MMVEYDVPPDGIFMRFTRNLSYTEESYLDNFSTCSTFVKPPRLAYVNALFCPCLTCGYQTDMDLNVCEAEHSGRVKAAADANADVNDVPDENERKGDLLEVASEEGVFVNMMEDLDSIGSPQSRVSESSDVSYFSLDSINSPEEDSQDQVLDRVAQQVLTEKVSNELQKSELRKTSSESSIEPETDGKNSDLKKTPSDGNFDIKLATLQISVNSGGFLNDSAHRYLLHVPDSPVYDEPEFNFNKAELRKSSSLKSNKTPPGTPRRKKMVRFADAMGLDLESIRHVLDMEHPPRIPASAIADLKQGVEEERRDVGSRYLDLCFAQPGACDNFLEKVMANKVALENCIIADLSITGIVRVANIGYHKCVRIRYSVNNWITFYDIMASYVQNSCDGPSDRFSFTIVAPASVGPGSKISFAASFTVNDTIYWDSNGGKNYEVVCYAKSTPTDLEPSWVHFV